jgi:hypothetical protein
MNDKREFRIVISGFTLARWGISIKLVQPYDESNKEEVAL